jgi:hypothetical protein
LVQAQAEQEAQVQGGKVQGVRALVRVQEVLVPVPALVRPARR